jgi:hypothetical protein
LPSILLKLDFEKAYDRVMDVSARRSEAGFEIGYIHRIMQQVEVEQTTITINGEVGPYFRNK